MKNGEILYKKLKLGEITKSQLTEQQKGDLYQYMVDSKKVTVDMIKPEVAQKYNLSVTPTPSRSPDTNAPIITPTYTPTHIPSRSPDTNAINYQPPKSTTPEMELVDILSNITMPTRGRTTQHERQQGSAYVPGNIVQPTPTDLTLADRAEQGIKGIGYNWAGGNLSSIGTIASIGSDIEVNHRPESSFISPKDFYPNNPEYKDNRIAETRQLADKLLAKGQQHTAKGREGLGTAGGVAYDILTGAGQMGADIGTAALTGVGMLPVLGTRVFGQGASEARQSGADINQQIAYGAISAGIEIATEKLVGGLPMAEKLGMGGVADNTIKKLAQGIASSPRLAKAFTYIANMAGEGAEEMIAEILSPVAKKMTYDPNADWATIEEVLYSGLIGAGVSGVMGGGVLFQGNQTPIETPTQTQSVMTNENIEPDIQGFQNTIDIGLNQLYTVLDSGQTDEQAINTMVTNLEKVKQLVPVLSNYVDGHIARLNNYKTIEQPQTNETNKAEQSIEQDTNVAPQGDTSLNEDIKPLDNIIPIETLRPKTEPLQEGNNIVTETQQLDNVTNVTENIGYHAGDLGKAEHFGRQYGSNRGTGHFGTGTYFVGDKSNIEKGGYGHRPIHEVDFSDYNLYKPENKRNAEKLHNFLKFLNTYYETAKAKLINEKYSKLMEDMYYETVDDVMHDLGNGTVKDVLNQLRILGLDEKSFEENQGMTVDQYIEKYGNGYEKKGDLEYYINLAKGRVNAITRALDNKPDFEDNATELFGISKEEAKR